MKKLKVLVSLFVVFSVLIGSVFVGNYYAIGREVVEHKIAGYGPLIGDLLLPNSAKFDDKYFYVMDSLGVSLFDIKTKDYVKEIKIDTGYSDITTSIFSVNNFLNLLQALKNISDPSALVTTLSPLFGKINCFPTIDFDIDSKGLIYVLGFNGINIYETQNGERVGKIDINFLPEKVDANNLSLRIVSFKIYNDSIYFLFSEMTYSEEDSVTKAILYKLDLSGKLLQETLITPPSEVTTLFIPTDFAISNSGIIGIISASSLIIYSESGEYLCSYKSSSDEDFSFTPSSLDFMGNTLFTTGFTFGAMMMPSEKTSIIKFDLEKSEEGNYSLKESGRIEDDNFGFLGMDIYLRDGKIALLTTGKLANLLTFRALLITEEGVTNYGKFTDSEGQIYGSISFAMSDDGSLYETNLLSPYIDVFNKNGDFTKRIEIDTKVVSSIMGMFTLPPTIIDMEIYGDDLYIYNLFPTNITKYSIKDDEWSTLWADQMMTMDLLISLPLDMKVYEDNIYLLGAIKDSPTLNIISQAGEIEEEELIITPEQYKPELPPLWFGICINDNEYQILDGINKSILIFDRGTKELKKVVNLSKELAIFTSIDTLPDGSWIITDVSNNSILNYGIDGKFIGKIVGNAGFVPRKVNKETYKTEPDKFFGLVRAKYASGAIYANDFFNFRYHIIKFKEKEEEKLPEIKFNPESLELKNFSIRENKDLLVKFTVTPLDKDFDLNLSSNVSWVQFKENSIKASKGEFALTIIGDNLEGWKENSGVITITSSIYPELKKEIPVKVEAVGIIIELTIDEPEAFVINKVGELKVYTLDVPPTIVDGRTFVPLRFFGDVVGAEVLWDNEERKVTYTKKDRVIILYVDKKIAYVNGEEKELDVAPFIKNGRTLVPVRFVSENLDSLVEWNPNERTVRITYPKK